MRLISVTALHLTDRLETYEQIDLFSGGQRQPRARLEQLERTVDAIRDKYGGQAIAFGKAPEFARELSPEEQEPDGDV